MNSCKITAWCDIVKYGKCEFFERESDGQVCKHMELGGLSNRCNNRKAIAHAVGLKVFSDEADARLMEQIKT
jgi:hypothetical protein